MGWCWVEAETVWRHLKDHFWILSKIIENYKAAGRDFPITDDMTPAMKKSKMLQLMMDKYGIDATCERHNKRRNPGDFDRDVLEELCTCWFCQQMGEFEA